MSEALARTVALLLVPDGITADGDERRSLAELRQRLVGRFAGTHDDDVAAFSRPELATEGAADAVAHLAGVLDADEPLAADLSGLLGDAEQTGQVGANLVLRVRADVLRDVERHQEALAAYDEILRREPDDPGALYWSAVSLRLLDRREDARARLERVRALEVADAEDLVLVAQQFLLLGERDAAAAAVAAAMELARSQPTPLPAESALKASEVWSELGEPERAVAVLEPFLAGDGKPDGVEVSAHVVAARLLLMEVGDAGRVLDLLGRLEKRLGSLEGEPRARMWLGHALNSLSRNAEALELLDERLADQVPPALRGWTLFGRGVALLETAEFERAEPVLREAATLLRGELAALAELMLGHHPPRASSQRPGPRAAGPDRGGSRTSRPGAARAGRALAGGGVERRRDQAARGAGAGRRAAAVRLGGA